MFRLMLRTCHHLCLSRHWLIYWKRTWAVPSELVSHAKIVYFTSQNILTNPCLPVFSLFFTAWSNALLLSSSTSPWPTALSSALSALSSYTPARPGDRTIIDSLSPFCTSLASGETFSAAVKAAKEGAASTRGMKAKLGRATYIGDVGTIEGAEGSVQEGHSGIPPDPGAWGVASIIEGVFEGLSVL